MVRNKQGSSGAGDRPRSSYGREIALVLLVKLCLILVLKFAFFNDPVKKTEVVERIDAAFGSSPAAADAGPSFVSSRK